MEAREAADQGIDCIVEIPKGSRNKYEWDEDVGAIRLDRFLSSSVVFPTDYGFVPETMGPEGEDPLDVLIAVSEPTFPGCRILARPVGLLRLHKDDKPESNILCVPCDDPTWSAIDSVDAVPEQLKDEIAAFFPMYLGREGMEVEVEGWLPSEAAVEVIEEARRRWRERLDSR